MAGRRRTIIAITTRIIVCLVILVLSGVIFTVLWKTKPAPERRGENRELHPVFVMRAAITEVRRQYEGYGTAQAMDSADVPARVTSTVIDMPEATLPGNKVVKGQILARLDPSDYERKVEIASNILLELDAQVKRLDIEAQSWVERVALADEQVALAQAEYDRIEKAHAGGAAKTRELDIAHIALLRSQRELVNQREELDKIPSRRLSLQAQRRGQEASLQLDRQNLDRCTIVSPISVVIQEVDVEIGENVVAGQRIARVVSRERIEVPLQLPASARPYLVPGDEVVIESAASSRQIWIASVSRIAPEDDEETRTVTVYVELTQDPDDATLLAPGKFVRATVSSIHPEMRWIVPRRSLRSERITLVQNNKIVSRRVSVDYQVRKDFPVFGLPDDLWLVLESPLPPGALVVITPTRSLAEGMSVEPVLPDGAAATVLSAKEPAK